MSSDDLNLGEPRQEAVFFYGLFLRGTPLQQIRSDICVPPHVLDRWKRLALHEPWLKPMVDRILNYRKHVLAIFDSLVFSEMKSPPTIQ
jgi:hypothetical protein